MASAIEKVIEIAANNLFDNTSVQTCLTAVTDLSNNLDTRVNAIIDSAPGTLDTLNELAAALGDDSNFATTVTNSLATKYQAGNDASFNVVDIAVLKVNGTSITQNGGGGGGTTLTTSSDISINAIDAVDASFNVLRTSATMALGGHILPTSNETFDLGSAEYKIRHLFLSDNSLWIGDKHKIDVSGGKMRFKKRKIGDGFVPQEILDASANSTATQHINGVIALFGDVSEAADIKLHHWEAWVGDTAHSGVTDLLPHQLFQKDYNFEENIENESKATMFTDPTFTGKVIMNDVSANDASFNNIDVNSMILRGNIIPDTDDTYDIGSAEKTIRDLYLGPASLYVNGKQILHDESGTITLTTDIDQHLTVKTSGTGSSTLQSEKQINITTTDNDGDVKVSTNGSGEIELNTNTGNIKLMGNILIEDTKNISNNSSGNSIKFNDSIQMLGSNKLIGDVSGNVTGTVTSLSNHDTDALSEGSTNLYFTDGRVRNALSNGTGVTITDGEISIGQAVSTNSNVSFNDLNVQGVLTMSGSATKINSVNLDISDNLILLNSGLTVSNPNDSGILINRGTLDPSNNAFMGWDESEDKFILGTTASNGNSIGNFVVTPAPLIIGDLSGNDAKFNDVSGVNFFTTGGSFIGDLSGNAATATTCTGNAATATTATKLENARTIGGVSFNGSANINLPGVNAIGDQDTTGNAATATTAATVTTNAQPNITSVGTLTGLVVSGDISGNDAKFNDVSGVNFFTTGGSFIGDLVGNVSGSLTSNGTVQAQTYNIGGSTIISASRQINNVTSLNVGTGNDPTEFSVETNGDISGNDAKFNDVSGVNFFTTGGSFIGDLVGNVTGNVTGNVQGSLTTDGTVRAGTYNIGSVGIISGSRQINNVISLNVGNNNDPTEFAVDNNGNTSMEGILSVNTINEKTSANGVTVDGVILKDSGIIISGDLSANDASFNRVDIHTLNLTTGLGPGDLEEDYIKTNEVDNSTIEFTSDTLNVKNLGITNAKLSGNITDDKLSIITTPGKVNGSAITGDISANDVKFNDVSGVNFFGGNFIGNLQGNATTAATVTTAAQPSITSVGTLTGLVVDSTITGNVSGGSGYAGYVSSTDDRTNDLVISNGLRSKMGLFTVDSSGEPSSNFTEMITMSSWGDGTAGRACALGIRKNSIAMRCYHATTYGGILNSYATVDMSSAVSDSRIKKNIEIVPANIALELFRKIHAYRYDYINTDDDDDEHTGTSFGYLAQNVREHYKVATRLSYDAIPNEHRIIENPQWTEIHDNSNNKLFKLTIPDLKEPSGNTLYKFNLFFDNIDENSEELPERLNNVKSMENDPYSFIFDEIKTLPKKVYIYGKYVNNFHRVFKKKLHSLHYATTKDIDRIQQAEKIKLSEAETEIAILNTKNQELEAKFEEQTSKLLAAEAKIVAAEAKITSLETTVANLLTRIEALENP